MELVFLGTSSMVPTAERNHSAILLSYKAENILIDCGEGTQRQFRKAKISPAKLTKLLITHWHGDHVLGIPGLLQTLIANHYNKTLEIYGPKGTKDKMDKMLDAFVLRGDMINFVVKEVKEGKIFENDGFILEAFRLKHGVCYGYNFIEKDRRKINLKKFGLKSDPILKDLQQGKDIMWKGKKVKAKDATTIVKGKKISVVMDTGLTDSIPKFCKNANLMVCEATLMHDFKELAKERDHLTSVQAGSLAKKAKVGKLVLTHFSQRYKHDKEIVKEAKTKFKNTIGAKDFLKISL